MPATVSRSPSAQSLPLQQTPTPRNTSSSRSPDYADYAETPKADVNDSSCDDDDDEIIEPQQQKQLQVLKEQLGAKYNVGAVLCWLHPCMLPCSDCQGAAAAASTKPGQRTQHLYTLQDSSHMHEGMDAHSALQEWCYNAARMNDRGPSHGPHAWLALLNSSPYTKHVTAAEMHVAVLSARA